MKLTREQEEALLIKYDPMLRRLVRDFNRKSGSQGIDHTDDLLQEARLAFLKHIRRIDDLSQLLLCQYRIWGAMYDYCRAIAPVKIPKYCFSTEIRKIHCVDGDIGDMERMLPPVTDEHILFEAEKSAFLDSLSEAERTAFHMKENGCTNRDIIPAIQARGEPQMTRFMQRIRKKVYAYFEIV